MPADDIVRAMPALRAGFESLKEQVREGRMDAAARCLFGDSVRWGEEIKTIFVDEDRERLKDRDPLTRFLVCRLRGMPKPLPLHQASAEEAFMMAFSIFPYLDAMFEETAVGEHMGFDEDGNWVFHRLLADEPQGSMRAQKTDTGWLFDLMPLYVAKAAELERFIAVEYDNEFELFLWRYVADHDLPFDMDQAWRPIAA